MNEKRSSRVWIQAAVIRFGVLLGLWAVFDGVKPAGLAVGILAASLATWSSLHLLPPTRVTLRFLPLLSLLGNFLWSSVVAGLDVALRAFQPRIALRPGFVKCDCSIGVGTKRDLFLGMSSLLPGSLPVGEDPEGRIVLHCLDVEQPVAEQMAESEARLLRAIGRPPQ